MSPKSAATFRLEDELLEGLRSVKERDPQFERHDPIPHARSAPTPDSPWRK
jgi:hypothetical protein